MHYAGSPVSPEGCPAAGNPGFASGSTDVLTNVSDTQTITRFGWFALLTPPQTEAPRNHWTVSDGVSGPRLFPTIYAYAVGTTHIVGTAKGVNSLVSCR